MAELTLAPTVDQPTVTWGDLTSSALASTVITGSAGWYREKRSGAAETAAGASQTSTAVLDLTGSTHYAYPGLYDAPALTGFTGAYVATDYKPGGSPQNAKRLFNVSTVTSSPTVAFRLRCATTTPSLGRIIVNGLPITSSPGAATVSVAGNGFYILLTFSTSASRQITVLALNGTDGRFGGMAVASGYSLVKP